MEQDQSERSFVNFDPNQKKAPLPHGKGAEINIQEDLIT
jgi:hypothetical protein